MTTAAAAGQSNNEPGAPAAAAVATPAAATATPAAAAAPAAGAASTVATPAAAAAAVVTPPAATAPEKYDLKIPDGGHVDATDLAAFEKVARGENWTNEQAQARLIAHADGVKASSARFLEDTRADSTYGGDKLEQTQQHALRALEKLRPAGTPRGDAFRALMNKTGYGNHIEVISLLADLGKTMAEDSPGSTVAGGGGGQKDPASVLYGGTPKP